MERVGVQRHVRGRSSELLLPEQAGRSERVFLAWQVSIQVAAGVGCQLPCPPRPGSCDPARPAPTSAAHMQAAHPTPQTPPWPPAPLPSSALAAAACGPSGASAPAAQRRAGQGKPPAFSKDPWGKQACWETKRAAAAGPACAPAPAGQFATSATPTTTRAVTAAAEQPQPPTPTPSHPTPSHPPQHLLHRWHLPHGYRRPERVQVSTAICRSRGGGGGGAPAASGLQRQHSC